MSSASRIAPPKRYFQPLAEPKMDPDNSFPLDDVSKPADTVAPKESSPPFLVMMLIAPPIASEP